MITMEPIGNSGLYLCRSKRFPGKTYLFNHKTGDAIWYLIDEDKNKIKPKNPEKALNFPEPNHPPHEETMTAHINPCFTKQVTMSPHSQNYYLPYISNEIPNRRFNESLAANAGMVMANAMCRSGPPLQPRCIPLSMYWTPTSNSPNISKPIDARIEQTSSHSINLPGNRNRVNNQLFEGRPKPNVSTSTKTQEYIRMLTEIKKREDINTSNNKTTSEEMRPKTSSTSNLLSQDAYLGTFTEFNESFPPNPGIVMANDMFRSGPPLQPMYITPSMYWTPTSNSPKTSIPLDARNEQTSSHSLNVQGNRNRVNNQLFEGRPNPNVSTSTKTQEFIRMLIENTKREDINTSNNMTTSEEMRPTTSSTSNILSQDVRTSTDDNTTIINTSSDRATEEPVAYRQNKNCKCHIWDQINLIFEKNSHCFKKVSDQDIAKSILEVVEKKFGQSQDEGIYQNNTEENGIELERDNLRMELAANKLEIEHQSLNKPASANKGVAFPFGRNEEVDSQEMTPYNMVTHQDQGPQEPASMSISQLKDLGGLFKQRIWLVVPDTEVLIFECDFLIEYLQSDEECYLYIPYVVQADIMSICVQESRGQERVILARKVARRLETEHPQVYLQRRPKEGEAEETIINCCQSLINENYHVILVTDNSSLIKEATNIHCFKSKVLKDGAQKIFSPIIIDEDEYDTPKGNKSKVDKNVTVRNTNVTQIEQNNNDILQKETNILNEQFFCNKTYEEFIKENKIVNQGNEAHFINISENSLPLKKRCGIMNDKDKDHEIITNHQSTNTINKNEVQNSNNCLKSHVKAHQLVNKNSNTIQKNDIFSNQNVQYSNMCLKSHVNSSHAHQSVNKDSNTIQKNDRFSNQNFVHETQKETIVGENKSGENDFMKINKCILQNTNVGKVEGQKESEEKNNNKRFNINSTEVTDYFRDQYLDRKLNKEADIAKMQNPNGNLQIKVNSSKRQNSCRNKQFIHTNIDVNFPLDDIGKRLAYYLERYIITDEEILDRITKRIDEWVNWYTQAMENFFSDIILANPLQKIAIPTNLVEYLEMVHMVLRDNGPVTIVIRRLKSFLTRTFENDTIQSNVDPNDFMRILGCSFFFLHTLKKYKNCNIFSTENSLKIMLRRIEDPETDMAVPQSPESIDAFSSTGDRRRKTTSSFNRTAFKKPRSEIIKYLDDHLNYSLEDKRLKTAKNELPTTPNIIRTIGSNLECVKLNSNQSISFKSVKAKPDYDIYMTKHKNTCDTLEGGPKVIRNIVLIDKYERKFEIEKIKDMEHSVSSRQVSNDSKNSFVDTLKMRFLDFTDNKDPKGNTEHKMRVKKLTEEFELRKKNVTNQSNRHEPKNFNNKQNHINCGKKTDTVTNNGDNMKISSNDKKTVDDFNSSTDKRSYANKKYNNEKVGKCSFTNNRNNNKMDSVSNSIREISDGIKKDGSVGISNDRSDCDNSKDISSTEVSREKTSKLDYCEKKSNLLTEVLKGLKSTFLTIFEHIRDKKKDVNKTDVQQLSRLHNTLDTIIVHVRKLILRESNEKTALYNFGDKVADNINFFTKFVDEAVILKEALSTLLAILLGDFDIF